MSSKDKMEINYLEQINVEVNQSKDDVINETSPNKKENWLTKLRGKKNVKKKNFETGFNKNALGTVELAKYHKNANRPLKKIREFDQSTKFCPCCSLPVEQKGYIERYKLCDDTDEFIQCGSGISLYFSFFRFSIYVLILTALSISLPTFIITNHYTNQLMDICSKLYEKEVNNINNTYPECINFIGVEGISKYFINGSGWALRFNGINLKQYRVLHDQFIGNKEKIMNRTLIDYSFLITTPSDYTAIVINLYSAFNMFWKRIKNINNYIKSELKDTKGISDQKNNFINNKKIKKLNKKKEF